MWTLLSRDKQAPSNLCVFETVWRQYLVSEISRSICRNDRPAKGASRSGLGLSTCHCVQSTVPWLGGEKCIKNSSDT